MGVDMSFPQYLRIFSKYKANPTWIPFGLLEYFLSIKAYPYWVSLSLLEYFLSIG